MITADNRKLVADALRRRATALDGVKDGVFRDPRRCRVRSRRACRCARPKPAADCLTEPQLAAIQTIYRGPIAGGERLHPGFPFGGEADPQGWDLWITQADPPVLPPGVPNLHFAFGTQFAKYFVFDDPSWTYANFDLEGWRARTADLGKLLNATNPDLSKFRDRGGKLILWHGWSDSALSASTSIEYYEAVQRQDHDSAKLPADVHAARRRALRRWPRGRSCGLDHRARALGRAGRCAGRDHRHEDRRAGRSAARAQGMRVPTAALLNEAGDPSDKPATAAKFRAETLLAVDALVP